MEHIAHIFEDQLSQLIDLANRLKVQLGATPVPKGVKEAMEHLHTHHQQYLQHIESGDADAVLKSVKNVGTYGLLTSQRLVQMQGVDDQSKATAQSMGKLAEEIRTRAENDPSTYAPLGEVTAPEPVAQRPVPTAQMKRIEQLMLEQEKHDERIKNSLTENERRLAVVSETLAGLEQKAQEVISNIDDAYRQTLEQLQAKKEQIDAILGHVSGRAIAGDYEKSASAEKAAADLLRIGSLLCMALIAVVLGYSFWETIQQDFQWQKSLFRVVLAFLLSAPAAYLARESSKHRNQQYLHLQTSLDLKAISPYLASLPENVQHRIKSDVAAKLFSGRDLSHVSGDSYPVNGQELLMELIKRLELPKVTK